MERGRLMELVIRGDQAWTPAEYEARQRRLRGDRERYQRDPERRAKRRAQNREWAEKNRKRLRVYNREWMRRDRARKRGLAVIEARAVRVVASLHSLRCLGPTKATGCMCRKVYVCERAA